jgi:predicted flavoprotein YhiN
LTNEAYIVAREAIKAAAGQEGKLFPKEQQSHYFALAALAALEKAGYLIQKEPAA